MIFMKIKEFSFTMHHGKFKKKSFSREFQSITKVSKLPWLQKKEYQE